MPIKLPYTNEGCFEHFCVDISSFQTLKKNEVKFPTKIVVSFKFFSLRITVSGNSG